MTRQEQIDEMAVIGCVRNPQAHTAEECAKCDFKYGQCNAYRHAEALYDVGCRKIDSFEEENERLREVNRQLNADYNRSLERLKSDCREIAELKAKLEAKLTCDFVKTAQKRAKIEVLNELKRHSYCDNFFTDGKWHRYVFVDDIDVLLEKYEND